MADLPLCHVNMNAAVETAGKVWTENAEELLPGFTYPIAELFKEWDWQ